MLSVTGISSLNTNRNKLTPIKSNPSFKAVKFDEIALITDGRKGLKILDKVEQAKSRIIAQDFLNPDVLRFDLSEIAEGVFNVMIKHMSKENKPLGHLMEEVKTDELESAMSGLIAYSKQF